MNAKGQNIAEYLLLIGVLALGFVVGAKYIRNIIKSRSDPEQYNAMQKWTRCYVANDDRKIDITTFTQGSPYISSSEKNAW